VPLLKKIKLDNFECFKESTEFELASATLFIGENNAGKSSIFRALCLFFDELEFEVGFLNKTRHLAKKKGSNISEITITFDLSALKMKAFKKRLLKFNKKIEILPITIRYIYRESYTDEIFLINGKKQIFEELDPDIKTLIESVKINYLHPQQGNELLEKAQEKLRNRLLDNWGRNKKLSQELNNLEKEWDHYRGMANGYLSEILSEKVKKFWGKGKVNINLPKSVKDLIKVGDISFQSDDTLPDIPLTSHGTGVQQSLLYYASFILDSDRTLRRNQEYHPVWLLEEPESFLHADMIIKLSKDLTSNEWLENIQLLLTTHSGLMLANSLNIKNNILWNVLTKHQLKSSYNPSTINDQKINEIGKIMGDPDFEVYFNVNKTPIFIEDTSSVLINKLEQENIYVKGLDGIDEIKKYLTVLESNNFTKAFL